MTQTPEDRSPTASATRMSMRIHWCATWLLMAALAGGIATVASVLTGHTDRVVISAAGSTLLVVALGLILMRDVRTLRVQAAEQARTAALAASQAAALAQETTYSQQLFMLSPVGLALRDLNSRRLLDANPAYLNLIGYDLDAARALPFERLCPVELQPTNVTFRSLRDTDHGQYPPSEAQYIHRLGHKIPVQLYGEVVDFRGKTCLLSAVEDIAARKAMELALEKQQRDLSHAQEIAQVGSWQYNPGERTLTASAQCFRTFGVTPGEILSTRTFWRAVAADDRAAIKAALADIGLPPRTADVTFRINVPTGYRWIRLRAEREPARNTERPRLIGSIQDVTEIKKAELATREALNKALDLARARSDFIANMSHEVRTPLNGVLGFAQIGSRTVEAPRARNLFQNITTAGQQLLAVVNDILDFSKLEAGKMRLESVALDVRQLVHDTVSLARPEAQRKGLTLAVDIVEPIPEEIIGDPVRLRQVLNNLLSNAVKFTDQGRVTFTVNTGDGCISFVIADTGIGMTPAQLEHLFLPFEQADTSTTRRYGGTGLGLAISQHLTQLMGGTIKATSQPATGSEFTVTLALDPQIVRSGVRKTRTPSQTTARM